MKASEHKVDKGKLSRTLKLNLESLIQLGNDSAEMSQGHLQQRRGFISKKLACLPR